MSRADEPCCAPRPAAGPDPRPTAGPEADGDLARLAKALGHPARVRILRLLAQRTTCVCGEIVEEFELAQSTVSEHLRVLKAAGLVQGEVDGPRVCYCVDPAGLERLKRLVGAL